MRTDNGCDAPSASPASDTQHQAENPTQATTGACTLTTQVPAATIGPIALDAPVTECWQALAGREAFQEAVVTAIRDAATGHTVTDFWDALAAADVDAAYGSLTSLAARTARGDRRALFDLLYYVRQLGWGRSSLADIRSAARLFTLSATTPTITVTLDSAFRDLRAAQRRDLCELLATLAQGCELRIVGTQYMQRWLLEHHRDDLPVSRDDITPPSDARLAERVDTARQALDPDGRAVDILRTLAADPAETMGYAALYADAQVSPARIRQVISQLTELECAASYQRPDGHALELRPAGRELLETIDTEIGRQQRLDECVSATGKSSAHSRVCRDNLVSPHGGGPKPSAPGDCAYLARWQDRAIAACAEDGGVSLVEHPIERGHNGLRRGWSYDEQADRLTVSAQFHNPMQWWVSIGLALTNRRTFEQVLDAQRLDEAVFDEIPLAILRNSRCLGYLEDAIATGEGYREALEDAREQLLALTERLDRETYEDRDECRSRITREALGLASTLVHLLDIAGVGVVREVRLPEFTRNYDADDRATLVRSIATGAAIQSRYEHFAAYRQLFEDRESKREAALAPEVDAADPYGALIGSFVIVGDGVEALEADLVASLRRPGELHEAAPEFAVPIPVHTTPGRAAYAQVTRAVLASKRLEATREVVSVMQAFTGSPYDAARALNGLGSEAIRRDVRVDEARYALGTLPAERILPDAAPTVRAIVHALLQTERPVSQAELAELADVSTRSIRTHIDRLVAFDIVRETGGGYRLVLSQRDEQYQDVLPWYGTPNRERSDYRDATLAGVIGEVLHTAEFRGAEAVHTALLERETTKLPPPIQAAICGAWPWAEPLLDVVAALAASEPDGAGTPDRRATFGATIDQTSITASAAG